MSGDRRYGSADWKRMRAAALARAGNRCAACGKGGVKLTAHHRQPVSEGGRFWDQSNVTVLCAACHEATHKRAARQRKIRYSAVDAEWDSHLREMVRDADKTARAKV